MQNSDKEKLFNLTEWDIIQVSGQDSSAFLQNLLTIDVNKVPLISLEDSSPPQAAKLGGYCSAQGRLLASFWITRYSVESIDSYIIWISKDIALDFVNNLKKYIFRSKVTINYDENKYKVIGCVYQSAFYPTNQFISNAKYITYLPSVNHEGYLLNRIIFAIDQNKADLLNNLNFEDSNLWDLLEIKSGIPRITKNTQDAFVPQMINFESLGGIDFKKGCYPGQEIVARSQYRGTIKRRLKIAQLKCNDAISPQPKPGDEIFNVENLNQPAGMVILTTKSTQTNETLLQVEVKLDQLDAKLILNSNNAQIKLEIQDPPYSLLEI